MACGGSLSCRALLFGQLAAFAASSTGFANASETSKASGTVSDGGAGANASFRALEEGNQPGQHRGLGHGHSPRTSNVSSLAAGAPSEGAGRGRQHAHASIGNESAGAGPGSPGPSTAGAQCLLWQGGERGCGAIRDRDLCLRSADGRPWRQWKGHLIYGQPCAWCGGQNCTSNTGELCMPADWVRGRPRVTVASCDSLSGARAEARGYTDAQLVQPGATGRVEFEGVGRSGFACRAEGAAASSKVNNFFYTFTARSVDECKHLCSSQGYCQAVEYRAHDGRCLLWWHPVQSMEPRPGHTCVLVRSRNGSGVAATALEPEDPNAKAQAVVVGAAGLSTAAGSNRSFTSALEADLRSTSTTTMARSTSTTTMAAFVRPSATEAEASGWDPSRDMLTVSPPARESVGSILKASNMSNGTVSGSAEAVGSTLKASDASDGTVSGSAEAARSILKSSSASGGTGSGSAEAALGKAGDWDFAAWLLCCCAGCAGCAALACAARPRTTRAAELEEEEEEENVDSDAHLLSDDLESALAAAAAGCLSAPAGCVSGAVPPPGCLSGAAPGARAPAPARPAGCRSGAPRPVAVQEPIAGTATARAGLYEPITRAAVRR